MAATQEDWVLTAFVNAVKTPDLRKKLLFVLFIIVLFRIGSIVPVPGVSASAVKTCSNVDSDGNSVFGILNMFSGGALLQLAVFALGIMPYITASIIIQLLRVVIPRLEALHKEGQTGQAKMTQYTRYLTVALAVLQATTFVSIARTPGGLVQNCQADLIPNENPLVIATMIITMVAGTGVIMWFGELITDRGVGNGMSMMIFIQILSSFPGLLWTIQETKGWLTFGLVVLVGLIVMGAVVYVEQSQRRIPVQYAKRMIGRRAYGGSSTYIPLKVNQAGVIPVIFASALLYLPSLAAQFNPQAGWSAWIQEYITRGDHPLYMALYFLLIIFFAYFYVSITFNPKEVADNMKKYGGFVPGIRAGRPTEEYLQFVLSRITLPGSLYLGIVALLPLMAIVLIDANQNFPLGGTSILIMVGVGLDTVKQIEGQLQQRHYEGFLR